MSVAPRRVLVVEDESAQRAMYEKAITRMGFGVCSVGDPAAARREIALSGYAVVLLDLNLAGESGMALFDEIRETSPGVSVVIATGFGNYETARKAISMDVVDFLTKPVSLLDLEAAIQKAWSRHTHVHAPAAQLESGTSGVDLPRLRPFEAIPSLRMEDIERELVLEALRRADDNRATAAKLLGVSERKLYYLLSRFR